MPVSIMLDAGHGGRDPGAVYNGRQEKDDVLKLVLAIGEILQNSGIDVERCLINIRCPCVFHINSAVL